jgi:ubiquinone biosynthesis protein
MGRSPGEVFAEFDWEPIAAASIGQAYRARLRSGERVIVKVERPGVSNSVERDLDVLAQLGAVLETRAPWAAEYHVSELVAEFSARLREELAFRLEGRNASDIAVNLKEMADIRVPRVHNDLTTTRVLVMEWLDGVSARQRARIEEMGLDCEILAETLLRCSLHQMLVDGHFHADPHPGNVLVLKGGQVALIGGLTSAPSPPGLRNWPGVRSCASYRSSAACPAI